MFPNELRALNSFVGNKSKLPMNPHTGLVASSSDPSTWATYEEALRMAKVRKWDGIGFCLEFPYIGLDLDHCIENGKMNGFAKNIVNKCRSYTEYSPSGTGVHIYLKGPVIQPVKTIGFELYQTGRFFTVTERSVGFPRPIREVDLSFIESLIPEGIKVRKPLAEVLVDIKPGERNNSLTSAAGSLRKRGYTAREIYSFLESKARECGLPLDELESICRSVERYEPAEEFALQQESGSLLEFMQDEKPVKYIVDGLIAENTINIIAGLQESRKSWLLIDLAIALASGQNWIGRFPCAKRKVMIVDQERPKIEMQRRIKALCLGRNIPVKHLEGSLIPVVGTTTKINLDRSYEVFCRKIEEKKPEVLLVDSLKAFQSEDITNNQAAQGIMERLKELRSKYGLTIVMLNHETKMGYARAREGLEVTAETIVGAGPISEVPECLFVATTFGADASILYHVKNSYGIKIAPCSFKVNDVEVDRSSIRLEAF